MTAARVAIAARGRPARVFLVIAVVLPFIGFSMLGGKQPTYILPLAAPLALATALMLQRWIDGSCADHAADARLPDVRITGAVAMTCVGLGAPALAAFAVLSGQTPAWAPGWTLLS